MKDPRSVVKPGDIVRAKVMSIDVPRKRIALSLRLDDDPARATKTGAEATGRASGRDRAQTPRSERRDNAADGGALGAALRAAMRDRAGK